MWKCHQVGAWLETKGDLAKYASAFIDEGVTGRILMTMTEETMKHKIRIQSLGHRKEIMRQVRQRCYLREYIYIYIYIYTHTHMYLFSCFSLLIPT
jgi:hypothetical protein